MISADARVRAELEKDLAAITIDEIAAQSRAAEVAREFDLAFDRLQAEERDRVREKEFRAYLHDLQDRQDTRGESTERGERITASLTIPTKGGDFPSLELQTVLNVFRGYYCLALDYFLADDPVKKDPLSIAENIISGKQELNDDDLRVIIDNGLLEIPYHQDLFISDIKRQNPIELVVAGIGYPLQLRLSYQEDITSLVL